MERAKPLRESVNNTDSIKVHELGRKFDLREDSNKGLLSQQLGSLLQGAALFSNFRDRDPSQQELWALKDISFSIDQGESVGIIGRNGAGKTTLLNVLSGILPPTEGRAEVYGTIRALLGVGTGFHPELSGHENVLMSAAILGMSSKEITERYDEIVDYAGTKEAMHLPLKKFSSGMQARLAFAVAANISSDILIVDEILAVGDMEFQKKCLSTMSSLSESRKRTVLFVSHELEVVRRLCNRVLLLNDGELVFDGSVEEGMYAYEELNDSTQDTRRSGSLEAWVEEVTLLDKERAPQSTAQYQEGLTVRIEGTSTVKKEEVSFALGINSLDGTRITSFWSALHGESFSIEPGKFAVEFTVPRLQIVPGRYELVTWIESKRQTLELKTHPKTLKVVADFDSTENWIPDRSQGYFIGEFRTHMVKIGS